MGGEKPSITKGYDDLLVWADMHKARTILPQRAYKLTETYWDTYMLVTQQKVLMLPYREGRILNSNIASIISFKQVLSIGKKLALAEDRYELVLCWHCQYYLFLASEETTTAICRKEPHCACVQTRALTSKRWLPKWAAYMAWTAHTQTRSVGGWTPL